MLYSLLIYNSFSESLEIWYKSGATAHITLLTLFLLLSLDHQIDFYNSCSSVGANEVALTTTEFVVLGFKIILGDLMDVDLSFRCCFL